MAVAIDSEQFTITQMRAGTAPSAWYVALGVSTLHAYTETPIGNGTILCSAVWE